MSTPPTVALRSMIPQDILQSNRKLTPEERRNIKKLAQDAESKLKAFRERLVKPKQQKKELLKTAESCQLALAPIRMLPHDVIGEIFLMCVRDEEPSMSCKKAPVLLTHICSSFRDISLSMPTLWATIALKVPEIRSAGAGEDEEDVRIAQAELRIFLWTRVVAISKWIQRSGTVPLSITCKSSTQLDLGKSFKAELCALARVLAKCAARWSHLSLQCRDCDDLFIQIMQLTPDNVPLLTSLHVTYQGRVLDISGDIIEAYKLAELSLNGSIEASQYNVNWSQLTRLTLDRYALGSTAKILRQAKKLVHLSLATTDYDFENIDLPHLRELSVLGVGIIPPGHPFIAGNIYAPSLETLQTDNDVKLLLTNLVKRSPCLRNLEIHMAYPIHMADPKYLSAWLRNCPQITSLVIVIKHWNRTARTTGLLEELVLDQGGTYTCPNLRIFRYNGVLAVPFDILCQFLGAEHNSSRTPLLRNWEQVDTKVFITDWGSKDKNGGVLNEVMKKWKSAGVVQLEIMNTGPYCAVVHNL